MNYGDLKTLIRNYLHRTDLDTFLPTFVEMAQARINRDVDVPEFETLATVEMVSGDRFISLPSDCKRLINVQISVASGRKILTPLSSAQMDAMYADIPQGEPSNYAIYGNQIEVQPTPGDAYTMEIIYQYRPALFSNDSDTNALMDRCPNIYVYAAMLEAEPFRHGEERSEMWKQYYDAEVATLNEEAEDLKFSGGPIQILNLGVSTP